MAPVASAAVFTLTFLLMILIVASTYTWSTYSDWKRHQKDAIQRRKRGKLSTPGFQSCGVLIAIVAILTVFTIRQLRADVSVFAYDPWTDLGLADGIKDEVVIKQAYRALSKQHHPDKPGGDAKKFQKIARAYKTLTDEKSLKNFYEFGNPEGSYFNVGEVPGWLSANGNSKDAGKRKAMVVMGGLVTVLLLVVLLGGWISRNRKLLNSMELGADTDPITAFGHLSPAERVRFMNSCNEAREQGNIDAAEYNDWVDIYTQTIKNDKEAAAKKASDKASGSVSPSAAKRR